MYLYGTPLGCEDDDTIAFPLRDVVIACDPAGLRGLARFLERAAAKIEEDEAYLQADWHQHYQDFAREDSDEDFWGGDVIVMQPLPPREDLGDPFLARLPRLVRAARLGQAEVVSKMLAAGEDPNQTSVDGYGGLHAASDANAPRIVELLLNAGTDIDQLGDLGRTPLMRAAGMGSTEIGAMLLAGADAARTDECGGTALIGAAASGNCELTQMLIDAGADIRAVEHDLCTPLTSAAAAGHVEIVRLLLGLGVRPDETPCGLTALMEAAESGHADVVQLLLAVGADPFLTDEGQTALDMAVEREHSEVAEILRAAVTDNGR